MDIREYIKDRFLIFDGAFGTYYSSKYHEDVSLSETANISFPERVEKIHKEYLDAGAVAIRTNTFGATQMILNGDKKAPDIIRAGYNAAENAILESGKEAFILADIGPVRGTSADGAGDAYIKTADIFLKSGAKNFIFETMSGTDGLMDCARYIRSRRSDAFLMVSFGVMPDGYTRDGQFYRSLLNEISGSGLFDIAGLNCVSNSNHMSKLLLKSGIEDLFYTSAMPNAGYPVVRGFRSIFEGNIESFKADMKTLAEAGVRILGGCCGTDPEYIKNLTEVLSGIRITPKEYIIPSMREKKNIYVQVKPVSHDSSNRIRNKLQNGEKIIAVELDSPKNTDISRFMSGASILKDAGADAITIADCPIARPRMDSTLLACLVKKELDLDVIPHMTCRDRNINATKALLLGAQAMDIKNILAVTGDPIPSAERDEVKKVYQFNSKKLIAYIRSLNNEIFPVPTMIFAALNVNAANFDIELKRAQEKVKCGADGFLTQPAMSENALSNLFMARKTLPPDVRILGGIIPVVSEKNGRFMEDEISGIHIPEDMISSYHGKNREEGEQLGIDYSLSIAGKMLSFTDGIYLMTPFGRVGMMEKIVRKIRKLL